MLATMGCFDCKMYYHIMFACDLNEWTLAISSRDCMDRPLAVGGASGAITSILLGLSRFYFNTPEIYWEKGIEVANQVCSCASRGFDLEDLPWWFFAAGLACGVLLGPTLDLCWLARERWRRFIWGRFVATNCYGNLSRPSQQQYKVIA